MEIFGSAKANGLKVALWRKVHLELDFRKFRKANRIHTPPIRALCTRTLTEHSQEACDKVRPS